MPFLTTIPIKTSTPICAMKLSGVFVINKNQATPQKANGIANRIENGWTSDSNWDAMTI